MNARWKLYKLTDRKGRTQNSTQWGPGIAHGPTDGDGGLCSASWLHAYADPLVAVFMNPAHAAIAKPRLWLARGWGKRLDDGLLKVGVTNLRTIEEMPVPVLTMAQRVHAAIYCARHALERGKVQAWDAWADAWLSGKDRSAAAAARAARAADAADDAAAYAAAYAADAAAEAAAARAARAAAYAAAADAASAAAAAAYATYAAARAAKPLPLAAILRRAVKEE